MDRLAGVSKQSVRERVPEEEQAGYYKPDSHLKPVHRHLVNKASQLRLNTVNRHILLLYSGKGRVYHNEYGFFCHHQAGACGALPPERRSLSSVSHASDLRSSSGHVLSPIPGSSDAPSFGSVDPILTPDSERPHAC